MASAQTHTFPALDTNNVFTGANTFAAVIINGTATLNSGVTIAATALNVGNSSINDTCVAPCLISLPSQGDILVGRDTTDTLTSKTLTSPIFKTGIANSGTGLKHGRVTTGSIGSTTRADVTLNWAGTAFANANYTITGCVVTETTVAAGTQSLVFERIHTKNAGSIVASVFNGTGGALTGTLECSAMHD